MAAFQALFMSWDLMFEVLYPKTSCPTHIYSLLVHRATHQLCRQHHRPRILKHGLHRVYLRRTTGASTSEKEALSSPVATNSHRGSVAEWQAVKWQAVIIDEAASAHVPSACCLYGRLPLLIPASHQMRDSHVLLLAKRACTCCIIQH